MGEGFRRRHREVNAVQALIHTTQHEFPVVDGAGRLRGVLTHDAMIRSLMEHGPDVAVTEVMTRDIPIMQPRLDEALRLLQETGSPVVDVVDAPGRLVGLITPEKIAEVIMVQSVRPQPQVARPQRQTVASPWMP
jgi:CBS domain-containing protein